VCPWDWTEQRPLLPVRRLRTVRRRVRKTNRSALGRTAISARGSSSAAQITDSGFSCHFYQRATPCYSPAWRGSMAAAVSSSTRRADEDLGWGHTGGRPCGYKILQMTHLRDRMTGLQSQWNGPGYESLMRIGVTNQKSDCS
jgi:hypothetical protein